MNGNDMIQYIQEEAFILIPVLFTFGVFLKQTPRVPDWIIPWVLLVIGVVLAMLMLGPTVHSAIQGILLSSATVMTHQLAKQTVERK